MSAVTKDARDVQASGRSTPERNLRVLFDSKLPERFWNKVFADEYGCWLWLAADNGHGYGTQRVNGKTGYAHRRAYQVLRGSIPDGLTLDHLCRVRHCVNPWHLEAVTIGVNTRRGLSVSGINARKTHCKRGHPLSGSNLYRLSTRSARICWECSKMRKRKRVNGEYALVPATPRYHPRHSSLGAP